MKNKIFILFLCVIGAAAGSLDARINIHRDNGQGNATFIAASLDLENYPEFAKFVKKFAPPAHIAAEIEAHKNDIFSLKDQWGNQKFPFGKFGHAYPLFVKGKQIDRVINAYCVRKLIKKWNLEDVLGVPCKYIYNVDGEWFVFVEYVEGKNNCWPEEANFNLTDDQLERLFQFQEELGYIDLHPGNILFTDTKAIIIDTEDRSFTCNKNVCIQKLLWYMGQKVNTDCYGGVIWYNHRFNSKHIDFRKVRDEFADLHYKLQCMKDEHD